MVVEQTPSGLATPQMWDLDYVCEIASNFFVS